jgi:DNA-binding MarR family transcriptional regulator
VAGAADPTDRRSCLMSVSPAGVELLAVARTRKDAFLARRLESLSEEDRVVLDRAAAVLERMLEEGGE